MPNPELSIMDGAITASGWSNVRGDSISKMYFDALAKKYHFKLTTPVKELPESVIDVIMNGTGGEPLELRFDGRRGTGILHQPFEGVAKNLERRYRESQSQSVREDIEDCMSEIPCPECGGRRLKKEVLAVTVGGMNIAEFTELSLKTR
jgi:excinuclease ABC subunit A